MNEIKIDLSKCIDNFKLDKDKVKQYGGYKKIAIDLSKENMRLAFENHILQSKIDKAIELGDKIIQEYEELVGLTGNLVLNFKQVLNILKEDK